MRRIKGTEPSLTGGDRLATKKCKSGAQSGIRLLVHARPQSRQLLWALSRVSLRLRARERSRQAIAMITRLLDGIGEAIALRRDIRTSACYPQRPSIHLASNVEPRRTYHPRNKASGMVWPHRKYVNQISRDEKKKHFFPSVAL